MTAHHRASGGAHDGTGARGTARASGPVTVPGVGPHTAGARAEAHPPVRGAAPGAPAAAHDASGPAASSTPPVRAAQGASRAPVPASPQPPTAAMPQPSVSVSASASASARSASPAAAREAVAADPDGRPARAGAPAGTGAAVPAAPGDDSADVPATNPDLPGAPCLPDRVPPGPESTAGTSARAAGDTPATAERAPEHRTPTSRAAEAAMPPTATPPTGAADAPGTPDAPDASGASDPEPQPGPRPQPAPRPEPQPHAESEPHPGPHLHRRPGAAEAAGADDGEPDRPGTPDRLGTPGRSGGDDGEIDGVDEALALVSGARQGTHRSAARPDSAGAERGRHRAHPWPAARSVAAGAGRSRAPRTVRLPLAEALGTVLAESLTALCDLPSFDTSAMDGWAVAGPGPWRIASEGSILAGHGGAAPLPDGTALRIATGARVPLETTAVIRSEHARAAEGTRLLHAERPVTPGQDIRPRGQECRTGDRLLPAGTAVTPAVLGLAAAAGYDTLLAVVRPRAEVLVLGDELLTSGLPHEGLIRDALGPMIGPWLHALGADVVATRRIGDDADALYRAVTASDADLVVTTGGTAAGPVDHVHPVLRRAGAELLVDQVAVRPGHPMLLARLPDGRHLVGLPGNPLAAVSGLLTLAGPVLRTLSGREPERPCRLPVRDTVQGHPHDTRLVPFAYDRGRPAPLHYNGPAMLRGVAVADGLVVIPPGGAEPGDDVEVIDLPWAGRASVEGGCFT